MKIRFFVLTLLLLPAAGLAVEKNNAQALKPQPEFRTPAPAFTPFIFDLDLSMRTGAENILSAHHWLTRFEDRQLGVRWSSEKTALSKTGGVAGRLAKLTLLDLPVDYFSVIFAHEYFGHGARYRELGIGNIDYGYDLPPPYGAGGGHASTSITEPITDHELLAIWSGGLEVQPALNRKISLRWLAEQEMHYREALVYFWSWQSGYTYVGSAEKDLAAVQDDDDAEAYVRIINRCAGHSDLDDLLMDVEGLKARNRINIANPFLFYSIFTALKTYLWEGEVSGKLPMINIAGVGYLPSFRLGLTPFGTEYHLENYLRFKNKISLVDLRIGDEKFHSNWGGAGFLVQNFYAKKRLALDMNFHVWRQPALEMTGDVNTSENNDFGGAFSLRGYYDFTNSRNTVAAVVELGYKSSGFIDGYALDSSPIIILGLAFR